MTLLTLGYLLVLELNFPLDLHELLNSLNWDLRDYQKIKMTCSVTSVSCILYTAIYCVCGINLDYSRSSMP